MILVADASFAVKVLLVEDGSEYVRQWWADESVAWWAPALIGAEVESAIAVHQRNHPERLDEAGRRLASTQWATMLDGIAQRVVDRDIGYVAIRVIQDHGPVRGADACYLALGLSLASEPGVDVVLGSFDRQQRRAAFAAGLAVTPA